LADLQFPCAIIDPIDGTRELSKGRAECAVSIALMNSHLIDDPKNYAWVYNPFSGFSIDSNDQYVRVKNKSLQKISGMVSRSELHKGLFDDLKNPLIQVIPRGSIAFKLGLLASGACDFIVSKNPKNIWDIAAGTILCQKRGYSFYVDGKKIEGLDLERYNGVLIWAQESQIAEIYQEFKNEK
jgi:myo-inositol-1(or 4)-monophosphatase